MNKISKRILIICGILLLLVGGFFCFRYFYIQNRFGQFTQRTWDESSGADGILYQDSYLCGTVKPSNITSFRGNLYVSYMRHVQPLADGNYELQKETGVDLLIYVNFPCSYTILAQICDEDGNWSDDIALGEDMSLKSEDNRELYDQYYNEILDAFTAAHEVFGVFTIPEEE